MSKYIIILLYLCISLSGVLCEYLYKQEGEQCEWEGLSGKCVQESACLTTLDDDSPKHPICSKTFEDTIICCTDCQLVNNTKDAIFTQSGLFWKNGQKARDSCLQYLRLPYKCNGDNFFAGIVRELDEKNKCYGYSEWDTSSSDDSDSRAEYPHSALLGLGEYLDSVIWREGGSIISDKYILTVSHIETWKSKLKFVALGVMKLSDGPTAWQVHTVKRFIPHPDYKSSSLYNDIALIETENVITFNKNVLPACLHVEQADDETAITTTWRDMKLKNFGIADTIQTRKLDTFSEEECKTVYQPYKNLRHGINSDTQVCYGSKSGSSDGCKSLSGEPLMLSKPFSSCIYSIIGVSSFIKSCVGNDPHVYTRVAPYKPWIESVVWP